MSVQWADSLLYGLKTVYGFSKRPEPGDIMRYEIMTSDQVAELLQVSRDMVYQLATRGELPGRKLGRIWRFSREAVDEFMRGGVAERPVGHGSERLAESNR